MGAPDKQAKHSILSNILLARVLGAAPATVAPDPTHKPIAGMMTHAGAARIKNTTAAPPASASPPAGPAATHHSPHRASLSKPSRPS